MATDNREIAATLTAGALGDQSQALKAEGKDEAIRWIVEVYRAILKQLDEETEESSGYVGFLPP